MSDKDVKGNGAGGGGDPPESPISLVTPESPSHPPQTSTTQNPSNPSLLKLDVKFELLMYNGELDAKKSDNWIKQIEVYCRIQQIVIESTKIQFATLRMGGTVLVWWESKIQDDLAKRGKTISSWYEFTAALKKQFYPLRYMQQVVMDWKN